MIAPCFNSSERSLELVLRAWEPHDEQTYHFRVVSSSATQIDRARLKGTLEATTPPPVDVSLDGP